MSFIDAVVASMLAAALSSGDRNGRAGRPLWQHKQGIRYPRPSKNAARAEHEQGKRERARRIRQMSSSRAR